MHKKQPIVILGAGSWGTALAILLARNDQLVHLWDHDQQHIANLQREHCNNRYLPTIKLSSNIVLFSDLEHAIHAVQDLLIVVPSHVFKDVLNRIHPLCGNNVRIVWGTKGIDPDSYQLLHQCVQIVFGKIPMAVLSGPSFAKEVALGLPTAVTLASNDSNFSTSLVQRFHNSNFRVYTTDDLIGVQIGGAVKNVIAIAVGASDGLGFGANARCALITRGLAEIARLGIALGARQETFMGLAGVGDLILTATDNQSRNRRFGLVLGQTKNLKEAEKDIDQVVEGVINSEKIYLLAQQLHIEMPIVETVYNIIFKNLAITDAVKYLMEREIKIE